MKRIWPFLICLSVFLTYAPAGLADEASPSPPLRAPRAHAADALNIGWVRLLNPLNNEEIDTVAGQGGYRVRVRIDNNGGETINGLVIVQVRNGAGATAGGGGRVLSCVAVSSGITAAGAVVSADCVLPGGVSGEVYVDVFVWSGWDAQTPLAAPWQNTSFTVTN
ncbi:hypothetical protein L9W92_04240 [Pelotomaculum terephthalicicum JT]|uniref:hypothetical protein n=1 Tax=Pelotomaculum terephthalicicum TaxID=206393 RepID=UPI001F0494FE|nr:hypothetical protein [Pelotomaculum terephthalicicum]MCG9967264.1 hypothetical protein [Pelotomaculum terephthalicicum JT]